MDMRKGNIEISDERQFPMTMDIISEDVACIYREDYENNQNPIINLMRDEWEKIGNKMNWANDNIFKLIECADMRGVGDALIHRTMAEFGDFMADAIWGESRLPELIHERDNPHLIIDKMEEKYLTEDDIKRIKQHRIDYIIEVVEFDKKFKRDENKTNLENWIDEFHGFCEIHYEKIHKQLYGDEKDEDRRI